MSNSINNIVEDIKKNFNMILGDCYISNTKQVKDHRHELFLNSLLDYTKFGLNTKGTLLNTTLVEYYFNANNTNPLVNINWETTNFPDPTTPTTIIDSDIQFKQYNMNIENIGTALPNVLTGGIISGSLPIHYELYIYLNTLVASLITRYGSSGNVPPPIQNYINNILTNLNNLSNIIDSMAPSDLQLKCLDLKKNIESLLYILFCLPDPANPRTCNLLDFGTFPYSSYINSLKSQLNNFIFTFSITASGSTIGLSPRYINYPLMFMLLLYQMNLTYEASPGSTDYINNYYGNDAIFLSFLNKIYNDKGHVMFTLNTVEYLLRKGIKSVLGNNKNKAYDIFSQIEAYYNSSLPDNKEYYRKSSNPNILYTKNQFDNDNEVDVDDPKFNLDRTRIHPKTTCYGSVGLDGVNNPTKCSMYINKCINGTDINECKQYMTNNAFWSPADGNPDSAINGVKNMSPTEAMNLLDKLAFKKKSRISNSNSDIIEYEDINSWLSTLKSSINFNNFTTAEYDSIVNNNNLKFYLKLVVDKINNNPSILNKNYKITKSTITPFYENMKTQIANIKSVNFPTNIIQKSLFDVLRESNKQFIPLPVYSGVYSGMSGGMSDGMSDNNHKLINYLKSLKIPDDYFKGTELKLVYSDIKNNLSRYGHIIQSDDDEKIQKLIEKIKTTEYTLMATLLTLLDYTKYVNQKGVISNIPKSVNLNEIIDLISEYNAKGKSFEFRANTLMDVLKTISAALIDLKNK